MLEYDFIKNIVSRKYSEIDQTKLTEEKEGHTVDLYFDGDGLLNYTLYRFDLETDDFLPFFNNTNAPEKLKSFCDYILLAEMYDKVYIILIELKSGDASKAQSQLKASNVFTEYIIKTAERIKDNNEGMSGFQETNIETRSVVLKKINVRNGTTARKIYDINSINGIIYYKTRKFDISHVCRFHK